MTLKRINADMASWEEPNPIQGQPPVPRSARRGEVVDLPDYYVAQKVNEKILVHYPAPAGETLSIARYEPVLVDPDGGDEVGDRAKADKEIADLEAKVAQLRATRPPAPRAYDVAAANEVVLAPSTTGVRLVGEVAAPLAEGVRLTGPVPEPKADTKPAKP